MWCWPALHQLGQGEGMITCHAAVDKIKPYYGSQHQQSTGNIEQKEFDGGMHPLFMAPDTDEKKHGNQLHFPEKIEQEKVGGQKDPHYSRQGQQQHEVKHAHPRSHLPPGYQYAHYTEQRGQQQQDQAYTVEPQAVTDAEPCYPAEILHQEPAMDRIRMQAEERYQQNQQHFSHGKSQPHQAALRRVAPETEAQQASGQRPENYERQQGKWNHDFFRPCLKS
jgi:hypothetical protein